MPALFQVGELVGPGTVVDDVFEVALDGTSIERVKMSWGHEMVMFAREEPAFYHRVRERLPGESLLVPFTRRHLLTEAATPGATWVDVSGHRFDYWRLLCDWWGGDDLTIVEHDVAPEPWMLDELADCPEPWCYFRYDNHTDEDAEAWKWGILGCTRFSSRLMADVPDAVLNCEERWRDWHYLSSGLGKNLRDAGYEPHVHGVVNHHRLTLVEP